MADEPPAAAPRRGRPRSEKTRRAILDAAATLVLERGVDDTSMDAIAERAGASKATIYRWWPTKEALSLDAAFCDWQADPVPPPDTGSLKTDLFAALHGWARTIRERPYGRVIAALIIKAHADPAFGRLYRESFIHTRRSRLRPLFTRAAERGEIPAEADVELALDCLFGPLFHRLLHGHAPLEEDFVRDVIDVTLAGIGWHAPKQGAPAAAR